MHNLVVQKRGEGVHWVLRGRVFTVHGAGGSSRHTIDSLTEFDRVLQDTFDIECPELDRVWQQVLTRHEALFGADD